MILELKNIDYIIDKKQILKKKSAKIIQGKHLLIHGPSGSGKTTFMNIMAGLLKPTSGSVIYKDTNYEKLSTYEKDNLRFTNFGFIFQKIHLIGHLNIEQNIAIAQNKNKRERINELMIGLGLYDKRKQKARDLSVGESQRVAIARGVVNNPEIVFADEPTSALDDLNTQQVMKLIFSQVSKTKATLIVSTHDHRIKKLFNNLMEII